MSRAAKRTRRTTKAKRRNFLRRNTGIIGGTIFIVAIAMLVALAIIPTLPVPAMVCAAAALCLVLIRLARLARMPDYSVPASLAEDWTAQEFRRLARLGWHVVDDVTWDGAEIGSVAVGPAGVLAVRTAVAQTAWVLKAEGIEGTTGDPLAPARTAATAATRRLAAAGLGVRVVPTVVVWGPGAPLHVNGQEVCAGVAVLVGRQAPEWRVDLRGRNLDDTTIARIVKALREPVAVPAAAIEAARPSGRRERRASPRALSRA